MTKSKNKILVAVLLAIIIMTNVLPIGTSLAAHNIGDNIGLTSVGEVPYHLKSYSLPGGGYVVTSLAGYHENGEFYPAYCLDVKKPGVDESRNYSVTLTEFLSNQETYNKVWRTIVAGYPYNSPERLGVSDWRYAYQATKMAVYCVLDQSNVNSFYATDSEGQQIVDLIHRLVNEGENGTATYRTPVANINKSGNMVLSGDYYIQSYTVGSNVTIASYNIASTNFPTGTKLTNTAGGEQNTFGSGETFQVRIPKNTVETQDINGKLRVDVNSKSYAVFYATSYNPALQDYAITGDPLALTSSTDNLTLKANAASIKIKKIDADTKQPIKDTTYELTKEDGTVIGRATTDSTGSLTFYELYRGNYILKEIKSNDDYVISQESIKVKVTYNNEIELTLENEKIKGKIEITKISADDNKLTGETIGTKLDGAIFEVYNEEDELADTITIKDGIGTSKLLEKGKYFIKEKNSGSDSYLLNTEKYEIEIVEHMKTIPITIENTSVDIGLDINKNGVVQAQPNDEIKYGFNTLKNTSNVALDNFTWTDNLPYDYVRITKLFTGTYNEDLDYVVKYKTNKSEEYTEFGTYNTQKNNYIDFTKVKLAADEYITDFKVKFGTVMPGFEAVEKPFIFAKVLPTVKAEDRWVNYTSLTGNYKEHELEDKAEWPTISYSKELKIRELPITGF